MRAGSRIAGIIFVVFVALLRGGVYDSGTWAGSDYSTAWPSATWRSSPPCSDSSGTTRP